jgi:hypothetical protein
MSFWWYLASAALLLLLINVLLVIYLATAEARWRRGDARQMSATR